LTISVLIAVFLACLTQLNPKLIANIPAIFLNMALTCKFHTSLCSLPNLSSMKHGWLY